MADKKPGFWDIVSGTAKIAKDYSIASYKKAQDRNAKEMEDMGKREAEESRLAAIAELKAKKDNQSPYGLNSKYTKFIADRAMHYSTIIDSQRLVEDHRQAFEDETDPNNVILDAFAYCLVLRTKFGVSREVYEAMACAYENAQGKAKFIVNQNNRSIEERLEASRNRPISPPPLPTAPSNSSRNYFQRIVSVFGSIADGINGHVDNEFYAPKREFQQTRAITRDKVKIEIPESFMANVFAPYVIEASKDPTQAYFENLGINPHVADYIIKRAVREVTPEDPLKALCEKEGIDPKIAEQVLKRIKETVIIPARS